MAAHALNDDRVGRALDAVAEHLDRVVGSVGAAAIGVFGVDVARMHWDMTSISLHGAYPDVEEALPVPKFGHPKDRRLDLKQIQTGIAVTGDGGVPVLHRVFDGGAGEVAQVVPAMQALQKMAGPARLLMVGDSKLVSYPNLAAMSQARVGFVAPASKAYVPARVLAAQDLAAAVAVDYVAARDERRKPETRGRWHVREDVMTLPGPRRRDPVLSLRRVFVHSSARARGGANRPGQETRPGHRGPDPARSGAGQPPLPRRPGGRRPGQADRPRPAGGRLPTHHHRHRRAWQTDSGLGVRPAHHRR